DRSRHLVVPTVQIMGEQHFTLLEAELKVGATVVVPEHIYIGRERREKIDRIISRISYDQLTANAKAEVGPLINELVKKQEKRFVDFFNNSQPVTPRMHSLELLPGIGKKSMWTIVNTRERKPFTSYKDIEEKTGLTDVQKRIERDSSRGGHFEDRPIHPCFQQACEHSAILHFLQADTLSRE